jgi:hypothetical protein
MSKTEEYNRPIYWGYEYERGLEHPKHLPVDLKSAIESFAVVVFPPMMSLGGKQATDELRQSEPLWHAMGIFARKTAMSLGPEHAILDFLVPPYFINLPAEADEFRARGIEYFRMTPAIDVSQPPCRYIVDHKTLMRCDS